MARQFMEGETDACLVDTEGIGRMQGSRRSIEGLTALFARIDHTPSCHGGP
jgi:hypothetical protein